jgi:hypothetical protein
MIRKQMVAVLAMVALLALAASLALAATQTLTGMVTEDMCAKSGGPNKHTMAPGKPDAECVRECVKAGAHYALYTPNDKKVYLLRGDAKQFYALAAQKVTVTGEVVGDTITVKTITAAK